MYACMHAYSVASLMSDSATLWTVAPQVPLSMGLSMQKYWNGLPCPLPGDLPSPGIEPTSLPFPALAGMFFITVPPGKPKCKLPSGTFWHPVSKCKRMNEPVNTKIFLTHGLCTSVYCLQFLDCLNYGAKISLSGKLFTIP